ncbi:MAG: TorF family putative porin [Mariprofundaceae bacterium]
MNKKIITHISALLLTMGIMTSAAQAEDINVGGDIGVYSQYMWRGMQQTQNASIQGDLGADIIDGLSANVWFSAPIGNNAQGGNVTEFDWTVDYSGEISGISYSLGYIFYSYLNAASGNTGEVYGGLGYGPVSVTYYYATNSNKGGWEKNSYLDVALGHSIAGFDLGADFGFYFGKAATADHINEFPTTKKGLGHVDLSISKDVALGDSVTMTPSLMISIPTWDGEAGSPNAPNNNNQVVAGVNFAY